MGKQKRPPCLKGAGKTVGFDWGIFLKFIQVNFYPSTAYAVPLPLGKGGND